MNLGGNLLRTFSQEQKDIYLAETEDYTFLQVEVTAGNPFTLQDVKCWSFAVLKASPNAAVLIGDSSKKLGVGDYGQGQGKLLAINCVEGWANILIAATAKNTSLPAFLSYATENEIKRVTKPWGFELWINGEHPKYSFKKIFIKAGHRTSLQYHRQKHETNFIGSGKIKFQFKSNPAISNDDIRSADLTTVDVSSPASFQVPPNTLHRIEAVTDIVMFEVSTAHLDDVVRISDDTARADGRIASEHKL